MRTMLCLSIQIRRIFESRKKRFVEVKFSYCHVIFFTFYIQFRLLLRFFFPFRRRLHSFCILSVNALEFNIYFLCVYKLGQELFILYIYIYIGFTVEVLRLGLTVVLSGKVESSLDWRNFRYEISFSRWGDVMSRTMQDTRGYSQRVVNPTSRWISLSSYRSSLSTESLTLRVADLRYRIQQVAELREVGGVVYASVRALHK